MKLELYVSPDGNDENPGTAAQPLKTLNAARIALRELVQKNGYTSEATVWLGEGTYRISETLKFGAEDSFPTVYRAREGERAVITSAKLLEPHEEMVNGRREWKASLPEVLQGKRYRTLMVNGEWARRPRLPETGFYEIKCVPNIDLEKAKTDPAYENALFKGTDRFYVNPGEMKQWHALQDVEMIMPHYWTEEHLPVESYDDETGLVVTSRCSVFSLADDFVPRYSRYCLENVYEAIKEGQWYLDTASGVLTYLPTPEQTLQNTVLELPTLVTGVKFEGTSYVRFENVELSGFDWTMPVEHREWHYNTYGKDCGAYAQAAAGASGAVLFERASGCGLSRCKLSNIGEYGVFIGAGSSGISVTDCEICHIGAGGIKLNGAQVGEPDELRTHHNVITGNHLHDMGMVFWSACGILSMNSAYNRFCNNHIHDLYYTAISVGWVWGHAPSNSHHNLVENNHLHHIGKELLSDMGGIYTLGEQPGTVVRGNVIHDIRKRNYGGWGIYPDEGSSYILIENNICHHTSSQGFHQHYGTENIVRNNIFAFCDAGTAAISRVHPEQKNAVSFYNNVFLSDGGPFFINRRNETYRKGFISDNNLFYNYAGTGFVSGDGDNDGETVMKMVKCYDFEQWKALGHDHHSVIADPCFADAQNGDFTVTDSAALDSIGFKTFEGMNKCVR
ncbi:MAG: right-handed parallel beta-helix repeat-containing protein [Clostridia bacterium]|nr:right-handed parallel beta-helix repeat-containing protein [Clostridia bacterium]